MKCGAIRLDGTKCQANAMRGGQSCFRHDKAMRSKARRASSDGGRAKRQYHSLGSPTSLKTPKDIQDLMERAINSLWTGRMPAGNPAGALGYLCKIFLEAYEKSELEVRLEALERRLDQAKL